MALEKIKPRVVDGTGDYTFNNVSATGNLTALNANLGNLAVANYVTGTLTTSAQPNITSVGTLSSVAVTGNITVGNVKTDHLLYSNGNPWTFGSGVATGTDKQVQFNDSGTFGASANFTFDKTSNTLVVDNFVGNGSGLSNLTAGNINGQVSNSIVAGTVYSSSQPNITSVGTLTSLAVTGNISSGNANLGNLVTANYFSGSGANLGSLTGANVTGQVGYAAVANSVAGSNVTGAVTYAATANAVAGANVLGAVAYATTANAVAGANVTGQVGNALVAGTVYTAAQSNITSVGTLTGLTSNGTVNFTNASNVSLGDVANLRISGGSSGYILQTDGAGNVQWVDNLPSTVTYNANSISLTGGVYVSGNITGIQTFGDYASGNVYVLTDGTGTAPAWQVDVDFLSVASFNRVVLNINYTQASGHTIYIQLYNNTTSAWDSIGSYTGLGSYYGFALEVIDGTPYINGSGKVQLKLYHSNGGNSAHQTSIDYVALELSSQGPQGPKGSTGATGATGPGVATGGTTGQVLTKNSGTNYDTAWSSSLSLAGNIDTDGNVHVGGNLSVVGNITFSGNTAIDQISGNSGQFFGDSHGIGALYAGLATGYAVVYNPVIQASADANAYVQINFQNINHGTQASTDFCATSDNGDDTKNFIDMGIAGGTWDGTQENSVGTAAYADDGYLYVQGNNNAGNLILGTVTPTTSIKFVAGGPNAANIVGTISNTGANFNNITTPGNLTSANANLGNTVTANYFSGNGSLLSSISGANVTGAVAYATTANSVAGANVSGTVSSATTAGTVTTASQPNITSVGTLTSLAAGDTTITGNLTVSGNFEYANVTSFRVKDPIIEQGGNTAGGALSSNDGYDRGQLLHYYSGAAIDAFMGWDNSNAEFAFGSNVTVSSEVVTFNTFGNVRANYFKGDGSLLTGIVSSTGNANYANYTGSVVNASQPNITSIGTLTSLTVSGNITAGNVDGGNLVKANYLQGNGSAISSITGGNVTGTVANATYATSAGTVGTVTANAQPNITSVGTLTDLTVTGNITSGNANLGNAVSANYFVGNGIYLTGLTSSGMSNGTSNVSIPTASGNVNISVAGNANVFKVTGTGVNVAGTGNFSGGITAGANINAGTNYILGNGYYLTDVITGVGDTIANGNSNITIFSTTVGISANATANVMLVQKTGVNVAGYINASGNIVGANANLGNLATANYFQGNGSLLTGITVSAGNSIVNGNSNVSVVANANVNISSTGNANVVVITGTGMNVAGTVNATGNITAAYLIGNGSQLTGISAGSTLVSGNSNVVLDANANLRISITSTANVVTISTNSINIAGNINASGNIITTGNSNLGNSVAANYFVGNGSLLTGIGNAQSIVYGNSNVYIASANANISMSVANTANVVVVSTNTVSVTGNVIASNVYANAGTIGALSLLGTLGTANQYTITTVGTLGNLAVTSNITAANVTLTGNMFANSGIVKAQYLKGDGSNITGIGGAGYIFNGTSNVAIPDTNGNVYITTGASANMFVIHPAGANLTGNANISGFANVTGNITTGNANLGNAATANYFVGNLYGQANTAGTVTASSQPNITSLGTLTSVTVTGVADLGTLSNVKIGGGASGYFLKTDGSGNLSWAVPAGGGGSGGTSLTYTAGTTPPASGNILGDQWFNTSTNVLYEYISDGTASYWVDVSSSSTTTTVPTTLDLANVTIAGGTAGQFLQTDGSGTLSFATVSTSSISNGNSNIAVSANGNIAFSSGGTSNLLVISNTSIVASGVVNLGAAANLRISGGANNQVLTSNGAGGATWQEPQNSIHPFLLMGA